MKYFTLAFLPIRKKSIMKYFILFALLVLSINAPAQRTPGSVSTPQHIVLDSKDNVFVTLKYGMLKIAPDGIGKPGTMTGGGPGEITGDKVYKGTGTEKYTLTPIEPCN